MHLRTGDYRQTDLWKPVGTEDLIEDGILPIKTPNKISLLLKNHKDSIRHLDPSILYNNAKQKQIDKTITQPTLSRSLSRSSISINLKSSDSTPRRSQDFDNTPLRKPRDDADFSPSRRIKREPESSVRELSPESSVRVLSPDSSPPRKSRWDSDNSPPRKQRRNSDSSPPRRARKNSDSSPPRRTRKTSDYSPLRNRGNSDCNSPKRPKRSYDNSPPRRSRTHSDISPPRTSKADTSPLRRIKRNSESSPLRNAKQGISEKHLNKEPSEPPKRKLLPGNKKGKYLIPAKRNIPSNAKTLEGKVAGLRSKESLIQENEVFRQREDELFKNMPSEVSGANASTIIRDRKTGKIRDLVKEAAELKEKEKLDAENKEKYARWGRGLKQVEAFEDKLVQDIHEMNKPLARYADDEDLEKYLIEQEREGDPMLSYIRKKKKKHVIETKKPGGLFLFINNYNFINQNF